MTLTFAPGKQNTVTFPRVVRRHYFLSADWTRMDKEQWRAERIDRLAVVLARSERKRVKAAMFR